MVIRFIVVFASLHFLSSGTVLSQDVKPGPDGHYAREAIQQVRIGWIKTLEFKEPAKPFSQNGRSYSAKQIGFSRQIGQWLQQSLQPQGLLGEVKLSVLAPPPSEPVTSKYYNFNEAEKNNRHALPNTYGAYAKLYFLLKKTDAKAYWPQGDYHYAWSAMVNNVELITKQMVGLSSPEDFYFTQPRYTIGMKGLYEKDWLMESAGFRNFADSPALKNYQHYLVPPKILDYGNQPYYVVVMTRDGKPLPFEQVTAGELLNVLEKQLPVLYKMAQNDGTRLENLMENAQRGLKLLRDKIGNRSGEFVFIRDPAAMQINVLSLAQIEPGKEICWLHTSSDPREQAERNGFGFPLLRLKRGVKEALANGEPQWIVFRLPKGVEPANAGEIHLMDHFVRHFNYDYVYQYFFGAQKPPGAYEALK